MPVIDNPIPAHVEARIRDDPAREVVADVLRNRYGLPAAVHSPLVRSCHYQMIRGSNKILYAEKMQIHVLEIDFV